MAELYQLSLAEAARGLRAGQFSLVELAHTYHQRRQQTEIALNAFTDEQAPPLTVLAEQLASGVIAPSLPLWGMPGGIKDNICTSHLPTTCGSTMLIGFLPPYDATVISRLQSAGYLCAGKTNLDEFAMGSSGETSVHGPTRNPWDLQRVPGGSSSGSAAAVASGQVAFALGSDTGGSVRQPASFCGVVGFKPTYGLVSRYGLVAFASSLDQIGTLTRTVEDAALVLNVIAGHDLLDSTSAVLPIPDYCQALHRDMRGLRIGVPEECFTLGVEPEVRKRFDLALAAMVDSGAEVEACSLPHMPHALAVYQLLSSAEASSNLARYAGVSYGLRRVGQTAQEMFTNTRNAGFGAEVKRRIMLGTYVLSAGHHDEYYLKAQRVRTLICRDFQRALSRFDALACPTSPTVAFSLGEKVDDLIAMHEADLFTAPVNLAGLPALSLPCGLARGLPVGLQLIGGPYQETVLLRIAHAYEQRYGFDHDKQGPLYRRELT